jgi:hypothetical protein
MKIDPRNLTAQLHHRARGNPESTLPHTAISNCFPGLEYDFRNLWRRVFVGLVLLENSNYVVDAENPNYKDLVGHRLLRVDGRDLVTTVTGPILPGSGARFLATGANPAAVAFLEWSNALAYVLQKQGQAVTCFFTKDKSPQEAPIPDKSEEMLEVDLTVRRIFEGESIAPSPDLLKPGELTQGLCSPWQNDYRECACYYWAASRPDFVNAETGADGLTHGDNWMMKERIGEYLPDDRADSRLISYDDLFRDWEGELKFEVKGRDAKES